MYKDLNDNELIYMINDGDEYIELLLKKYSGIIRNICQKYKKIGHDVGYELDDLIQIANISLIRSITTFKETKNILFYTYAVRCIENNIRTELRLELCNCRKVLNESFSYNKIYKDSDVEMINFFQDDKALNPIDCLIIDEMKNKYNQIINELPIEVAVAYEMRICGFSVKEISTFLQTDSRNIYYYFRYAKNRLCLN